MTATTTTRTSNGWLAARLGRWLRFRVPFAVVAYMSCLRLRLASAFSAKVEHPDKALPPALAGAVATVTSIFSAEGDDGTVLSSTADIRRRGGPPYQQAPQRVVPVPTVAHARGGRQGHPGRGTPPPGQYQWDFSGAAPGRGRGRGRAGSGRQPAHPARGHHWPGQRGRGGGTANAGRGGRGRTG
eukprot:jgi/Tetstr1/445387/TSEL_033173.t1